MSGHIPLRSGKDKDSPYYLLKLMKLIVYTLKGKPNQSIGQSSSLSHDGNNHNKRETLSAPIWTLAEDEEKERTNRRRRMGFIRLLLGFWCWLDDWSSVGQWHARVPLLAGDWIGEDSGFFFVSLCSSPSCRCVWIFELGCSRGNYDNNNNNNNHNK